MRTAEVRQASLGAYTRKQTVRMGRRMAADYGVVWFEEPVSSNDPAGLREVRDACEVDVAAGEYGHMPAFFASLIADTGPSTASRRT